VNTTYFLAGHYMTRFVQREQSVRTYQPRPWTRARKAKNEVPSGWSDVMASQHRDVYVVCRVV